MDSERSRNVLAHGLTNEKGKYLEFKLRSVGPSRHVPLYSACDWLNIFFSFWLVSSCLRKFYILEHLFYIVAEKERCRNKWLLKVTFFLTPTLWHLVEIRVTYHKIVQLVETLVDLPFQFTDKTSEVQCS